MQLNFFPRKDFQRQEPLNFKKKDIKKIKNNFIKNLLEFDGIELILVSENFISVKKMKKLIGTA